jgi:hypothetical protein
MVLEVKRTKKGENVQQDGLQMNRRARKVQGME